MNIPGHGQVRDQRTLLKAFINTFTSEEFMVDLVRIILHPSEFGAFTSERSNSAIEYIRDFLKGLGETARRLQLPAAKNIQSQIQVVNTLLTIRESSSSLLTYDNVFQHLATRDLITTKLIQKSIENKLTEDEQFRKLTDNVIDIIHAYYEVISVSSTITLLDNLQESILDNNLTPFEALKNYKDLVITAYNDLSKLQSLSKAETIADYFIISDEDSCSNLANTLVNYISKGFSVFKTGFDLFDNVLGGVESSSVHLLAAPSNHGKSILCVNLCRRMIESNISDLDKKDTIIFLTLEDDIHKLSRRFISVFGNYKFEVIKQLFAKAYEVTRTQQIMGLMDSSDNLIMSLQKMFKNLLKTSLLRVTQGKCSLVIKHCNENTFSPGDLGRFIDRLKVEGYKTKLIFVDYIDTMTPTTSVFGNVKEYDTQGQIVQELRNLSRIHGIPVISPTQNQRDSEDVTKLQSNKLIGDSYKKIRYSDFIYMMRMREDKNFLSEGVREQVISKKKVQDGIPQDSVSPEVLAIKDKLASVLIPIEIKITKSKDSEKNKSRFLLFCKENLRIYNNIDEYIQDSPILKINSSKLEKDIDLLVNQAITSVVATDFMETTPSMVGLHDILQTDHIEIFQPSFQESSSSVFH
ncbi:MAG TPA: DnaB-like helicase C-terminal domain-containing protein [Candidatus Dojkabacteria bacterium]|nr:DnaB-like helicase C-terminal domain-containing protein [Candidatus Dojkabacteria bacterium]